MAMGPTGIRTETYAPSLQEWRRSWPRDERLLKAQIAVQEYRRVWTERSADLAAGLYAPEATIIDDLLGIDAHGRMDVGLLAGASAGEGTLPGLDWISLPDMGGPGIFIAGGRAGDAQLDSVVLLARTTGCPRHLAIVMHLDSAGLIDEETRLHRIDDLTTCPTTPAATTWWDGVEVPPAVAMTLTGTLQVAEFGVEIFNGSPTLEKLARWGFDRYAAAGLGTPAVDRIRFLSSTTDTCQHVAGLNLGAEITLCGHPSTPPTAFERATLLHELGHAWMNGNLGQADRERFVDTSGKPTWASTTKPWGDRGVELAASTLSWALMDEPQPLNSRLGVHSCDELAALYPILVGKSATTAPPCPYGDVGGPAA